MDECTRKRLEECGVNVDEGIKMHMGNERMFLKILKLVIMDEKFETLFNLAY